MNNSAMIKTFPLFVIVILTAFISTAQTNTVCRNGDTIHVTGTSPIVWYETVPSCLYYDTEETCPIPACTWLVEQCVPEEGPTPDLCTELETESACLDVASFGCRWSGSSCSISNNFLHLETGEGDFRVFPPDSRKHITLDNNGETAWFVSSEVDPCPECVATITADDSLCENEAAITVLVDTTGGTWQGNGIKANGEFVPSDAGVGTHTISYVLSCGTAGTADIVVSGIPNVELAEFNPNSVSESDGVQPLPAGSPSNGTYYDSTELVITDFDPSIYGQGIHTVYYVVLENGCQGLDTSSITVTVVTDVSSQLDEATQIYPNPIVGNQLHVELGMPYTSLSGKVINQAGIEMAQFSNSNNKELILNTETWMEGVYQVALHVDGTLVTFKVVK